MRFRGGINNRRGTGTTKPFDYSYVKVYDAALEVAKIQSLTYKKGGKKQYFLMFKNSGDWHVSGELISIYFTEESDNKTVIEVVNQKNSKYDIGNHNWMNGFFHAMDLELEKSSEL